MDHPIKIESSDTLNRAAGHSNDSLFADAYSKAIAYVPDPLSKSAMILATGAAEGAVTFIGDEYKRNHCADLAKLGAGSFVTGAALAATAEIWGPTVAILGGTALAAYGIGSVLGNPNTMKDLNRSFSSLKSSLSNALEHYGNVAAVDNALSVTRKELGKPAAEFAIGTVCGLSGIPIGRMAGKLAVTPGIARAGATGISITDTAEPAGAVDAAVTAETSLTDQISEQSKQLNNFTKYIDELRQDIDAKLAASAENLRQTEVLKRQLKFVDEELPCAYGKDSLGRTSLSKPIESSMPSIADRLGSLEEVRSGQKLIELGSDLEGKLMEYKGRVHKDAVSGSCYGTHLEFGRSISADLKYLIRQCESEALNRWQLKRLFVQKNFLSEPSNLANPDLVKATTQVQEGGFGWGTVCGGRLFDGFDEVLRRPIDGKQLIEFSKGLQNMDRLTQELANLRRPH